MGKLQFMGVFCAVLSGTAIAKQHVEFEFRDPDSGQIAVRAFEEIHTEGNSIVKETRYLGANGENLLTESYRSVADGGRLERYSSHDLRTGEQVEVSATKEAARLEVRYRPAAADDWRKQTIDWGSKATHGKALPELILARWDELVTGKTVEVDLLVPSRLETIGFRILHDPSLSKETGREVFVVEASAWFIRLFAPTLTFTFSSNGERRFLSFSGPAPVEINGKKHQPVIAEFNVSPLK